MNVTGDLVDQICKAVREAHDGCEVKVVFRRSFASTAEGTLWIGDISFPYTNTRPSNVENALKIYLDTVRHALKTPTNNGRARFLKPVTKNKVGLLPDPEILRRDLYVIE